MVLLYIACALTISDFEIVSVVTMLIWISIPALAIYIRHDFGHVKSRRQKRPSFLSPQLFHHGLSVSHYLYSCLTSFSLAYKDAQTRFFKSNLSVLYLSGLISQTRKPILQIFTTLFLYYIIIENTGWKSLPLILVEIFNFGWMK